jgi:serine-type anaerobic sulfatase-maturating enzyme
MVNHERRTDTLRAFHVMAKPTGSKCNLDCAYCFYLKKEQMYPESDFRMSDAMMEQYIRQTIEGHGTPEVTIAWQGGEPTLMGLDFFRRAVEVEKKYAKPGRRIENTFQTNGVLLNEDWCRFFHEQNFLIGLSIDGPRHLHDAYRRDKGGAGTFDKVMRAARLMQQHKVEFNVLCTVNSVNSRQPLEVYRFFRDELGAHYLQFIPIVERDNDTGHQEGTRITDRSVRPEQWGRFLIEIFDEWVRRDVGSTFVLFFDGVLASYVRGYSTLCILQPTCGQGVALEHTGDVYSCDHYVEPKHWLGNIQDSPIGTLVASEKQRAFGEEKSSTLPDYCRRCEFLFTCHGECPKNRVLTTRDGGPGLNWLCAGLKAFYAHTERPMRIMAELLQRGRYADEVMQILAKEEAVAFARAGRNDPCPCGNGRKFKRCHGPLRSEGPAASAERQASRVGGR